MSLLLESAPAIPTWVAGAVVLFILLFALTWIVSMGSGRPNTK